MSDGNISHSDGFWGLNQYKTTVKRAENGQKLCNELVNFIQERADIEKNYSNNLKKWAHKWETHLPAIGAFGSSLQTWSSFCDEADKLALIHSSLRNQLIEEVQSSIRIWQKENYHKQPLPLVSKEVKYFESEFQRAQKPWAKKLKKLDESKKDFFNANRVLNSSKHQLTNAQKDANVSLDQIRKLDDRIVKAENDLKTTRDNYETSLKDLTSFRERYVTDMTEIFEKCQEFEQKRLRFFEEIYGKLSDVLDVSSRTDLGEVYEELHKSVGEVDIDADLKSWSELHGVDSPATWPEFEEYSTEFRSISKDKAGGGGVLPDQGVTLRSITLNTENVSRPKNSSKPFQDRKASSENSSGVFVKALYDYNGDDGELSFKAGDVIEKLSDKDDLGWCRGQVNGFTGVYPAGFVEPLTGL